MPLSRHKLSRLQSRPVNSKNKRLKLRGGKVPGLDFLKGRLVLAVEEQSPVHGALVARALTEAGARLAGPFNSCDDAVSWLETNTPELAVLDVALGASRIGGHKEAGKPTLCGS